MRFLVIVIPSLYIQITEENYRPEEFEDQIEERDDWLQPETISPVEFMDDFENDVMAGNQSFDFSNNMLGEHGDNSKVIE